MASGGINGDLDEFKFSFYASSDDHSILASKALGMRTWEGSLTGLMAASVWLLLAYCLMKLTAFYVQTVLILIYTVYLFSDEQPRHTHTSPNTHTDNTSL